MQSDPILSDYVRDSRLYTAYYSSAVHPAARWQIRPAGPFEVASLSFHNKLF